MTTEITIDTGTNELLCVIRDRVAIITLNRPEARNAMSDDLTPALRNMIKTCGENPEVGALLITGAGTAFCAGGNVKGMGANRDKKKLEMSHDERVADLQERQRLLTGALVSVRKPTIAALPGPAVGAGLALAMACDIRIAAQSAFLSTGYLKVGLSGDYGIAWLLTRLVGTSRARELMFTCERVDANRCETIGLVNRVVPDDKLQAEAFALAKSIAEGPTIAIRYMKDNLDEALMFDFATARDHEAERMIRTQVTADHKEAVRPSSRSASRCSRAARDTSRRSPTENSPVLVRPEPGQSCSTRERSCREDGGRRRRASSSRRGYRAARRRWAFQNAPASSRRGGHEGVTGFAGEADHGLIGTQGVAEQPVSAERGRAAFEIFQQRLADAMALPAIVDRQAEFDAAVHERITGFADDDLVAIDQHGRDHAETIGLADMDELLEHGRRQFAGGAEEAVVAGAGRQRAEIVLQRLGIARLDEAHGQSLAAARAQQVGILPEIVETHRRHRTLP